MAVEYTQPFGSRYYAQDEDIGWEPHEVETLRMMYQSKRFSYADICNKLQRSRGSISGKARKLGLRRP